MMKVLFLYLWSSCAIFRLGDFGTASDKCQEYAGAVYSQEFSPVLSMSSVANNVSNCGIVSTPLIVGGTEATPKEFPHQAIIGYENAPRVSLIWGCGGSLISDDYVLTAAHCLTLGPKAKLSQKVRFGIVDKIDPEPDGMQELQIIERIGHPEYVASVHLNDIGLLRLDHSVKFTAFVRPACLNTLPAFRQSDVIATGFGRLKFEAKGSGRSLMKTTLNMYDISECIGVIKMLGNTDTFTDGIPDTWLCAGDLEGARDTCKGDSGSPLQVILHEPYCMYSVIGITSFGIGCGLPNTPALYTNVEKYIPWIENVVWPTGN